MVNNGGKASSGDIYEEPLSPAALLFQAPNFNCHIIAIMGCKTSINPSVIKEGLQHTLIKHPRFSSKLVRGKQINIYTVFFSGYLLLSSNALHYILLYYIYLLSFSLLDLDLLSFKLENQKSLLCRGNFVWNFIKTKFWLYSSTINGYYIYL